MYQSGVSDGGGVWGAEEFPIFSISAAQTKTEL